MKWDSTKQFRIVDLLTMKYIDLHVHSNASDGTLPPLEVVKKAIDKNLAAFALTDHDTVKGIPEAVRAAKEFEKEGKFIQVIPGTELSVAYKQKDVHMLGLFIDYKDKDFLKTLEDAAKERDERNLKMIQNLANAGIDISMEKLRASEGNAILTRAHFAKYLYEHGYVKSRDDAFKKYLNEDSPYYVKRKFMTPENAITLIKKAGGIPVLAHPLLYKLSGSELETLISTLKDAGLVGVEAIYNANMGFDESYVKQLAHKYDLLITGGSDFHGANKPLIDIGTGKGNLRIPYSILETLDEYRKK